MPDVIETHGTWSKQSKIYESKTFEDKYTPIVFENNFLWVRHDILSRLQASPLLIEKQISDLSFLESVRYNHDIDQFITKEKLSYILVFDALNK